MFIYTSSRSVHFVINDNNDDESVQGESEFPTSECDRAVKRFVLF